MTISLTLPFPVSVNAMYINATKGRRKSPRYRDWLTAAGWALKAQYRGSPMTEPIMLQIALRQPNNRKRDLDNCAKGIQDLLTGTVIKDDSQIMLLFLWWEDNVKGGEARVMIDPISCPMAQRFIASHDARYNEKSLPIQGVNDTTSMRPDGYSEAPAKPPKLTCKGGQNG